MSEFEYNTGYFYPLSDKEYQILNDVDFFGNDIIQPPFYLVLFGHNKYLVLSQTHSYGIENHEFGNSRPLTDNESNLVPMKFSNEFTKIKFQASKFKFVEYCYYNSVDSKDYYLESSKPKQSEPMTLNEAIQHCKDVAASKCDECGKEHQQLAEWLQELEGYKDETPITRDYLKSVRDNLKTNDCIELSFGEYDEDCFCILVKHIIDVHEMCTEYDPVMQWKCTMHTVGQFRMFMTICGLEDFVKQLKS